MQVSSIANLSYTLNASNIFSTTISHIIRLNYTFYNSEKTKNNFLMKK